MSRSRSGAAAQKGGRRADYYAQARPEVADLVPAHSRRVLDVGCAEGQLGRLLKARGHHVTGIELVPEAAERARMWLDRVEVVDIETEGFPFPAGSFDAVIFADVLEHLIDPWRLLREASALLSPSGCVIVSVPNVQNLAVLRRLASGRWDYRERGILDFGHLRFFTLKSLRRLFEQAGLALTHIGYRYRETWPRRFLSSLTAGWARAYFARQYVAVGSRQHMPATCVA
jgi:SAM-dependent methyltransferase